eukprot:4560761-Prymnesium_polylepis.1
MRIYSIVGEGVVEIKRPPEYLKGHGALLIEMAGACWELPEFFGNHTDVVLISTFKQKLLQSFADPNSSRSFDHAKAEACFGVVRELWSLGGPLYKLALATATRDTSPASGPGGLLEWLRWSQRDAAVHRPPEGHVSGKEQVEQVSVRAGDMRHCHLRSLDQQPFPLYA